jgi:hypothetical protein
VLFPYVCPEPDLVNRSGFKKDKTAAQKTCVFRRTTEQKDLVLAHARGSEDRSSLGDFAALLVSELFPHPLPRAFQKLNTQRKFPEIKCTANRSDKHKEEGRAPRSRPLQNSRRLPAAGRQSRRAVLAYARRCPRGQRPAPPPFEKTALFLSFPYDCPEPVLVKC